MNIVGSFIIGLIIKETASRANPTSNKLLPFVVTGFLGRCTASSRFSLETLRLFSEGRTFQAV